MVGNPSAILEAARTGVAGMGMRVGAFSAAEGYLETRWFHPGSRVSRRENTNPEELVKLRVWADLVTPRESQVVVEAVYRSTIDPSQLEREVEEVAREGTPGDSLSDQVRALVRERFNAPRPSLVR